MKYRQGLSTSSKPVPDSDSTTNASQSSSSTDTLWRTFVKQAAHFDETHQHHMAQITAATAPRPSETAQSKMSKAAAVGARLLGHDISNTLNAVTAELPKPSDVRAVREAAGEALAASSSYRNRCGFQRPPSPSISPESSSTQHKPLMPRLPDSPADMGPRGMGSVPRLPSPPAERRNPPSSPIRPPTAADNRLHIAQQERLMVDQKAASQHAESMDRLTRRRGTFAAASSVSRSPNSRSSSPPSWRAYSVQAANIGDDALSHHHRVLQQVSAGDVGHTSPMTSSPPSSRLEHEVDRRRVQLAEAEAERLRRQVQQLETGMRELRSVTDQMQLELKQELTRAEKKVLEQQQEMNELARVHAEELSFFAALPPVAQAVDATARVEKLAQVCAEHQAQLPFTCGRCGAAFTNSLEERSEQAVDYKAEQLELQETRKKVAVLERDLAQAARVQEQMRADMQDQLLSVQAAHASELSSREQLQSRMQMMLRDQNKQVMDTANSENEKLLEELDATRDAHAQEQMEREQLQRELSGQVDLSRSRQAAERDRLHEQQLLHESQDLHETALLLQQQRLEDKLSGAEGERELLQQRMSEMLARQMESDMAFAAVNDECDLQRSEIKDHVNSHRWQVLKNVVRLEQIEQTWRLHLHTVQMEACTRHQCLMRLVKAEAQEDMAIARAAHLEELEQARLHQLAVFEAHAAEVATYQELQQKLISGSAGRWDVESTNVEGLLEDEPVAMRAAYKTKLQVQEDLHSSRVADCGAAQTSQVIAEMEEQLRAVREAYTTELRMLEEMQATLQEECHTARAQTVQVTAELEEEMARVHAAHAAEMASIEQLQSKLEQQHHSACEECVELRNTLETARADEKARMQRMQAEQQAMQAQIASLQSKLEQDHAPVMFGGRTHSPSYQEEELRAQLAVMQEELAARPTISESSTSVKAELEEFAVVRAAHATELTSLEQLLKGVERECDAAKAEVVALKKQLCTLKQSHASELSTHEQFHCANVEFEEKRDAEWADAVAAKVELEEQLKQFHLEKDALEDRVSELLGLQMSSDIAFAALQDEHDGRLAELRGLRSVGFGAQISHAASPEACIAQLHSPSFEEVYVSSMSARHKVECAGC